MMKLYLPLAIFLRKLEIWGTDWALVFSSQVSAGEIIFYPIRTEIRSEGYESLICKPWLFCWNFTSRSFNLFGIYFPHYFKYCYVLPLLGGRGYSDNSWFIHKPNSYRNIFYYCHNYYNLFHIGNCFSLSF